MKKLKFLTFLLCAVTLALPASAVYAAVTNVICVPWQGDINKYHTTWAGYNVYLKGVIKTDSTAQIWYKWNFGDGTSSGVYSTSGRTKYSVEIRHVYTGAQGTPFTAQLQVDAVDSSMANAVTDNYLIKIENHNLDAKINAFDHLLREDPNVDSPWTHYHANISRKLFKGKQGES